jgi:hypothetical protein
MTLNEILTLIALVGGPVTAVLLTRYVDQNREKSGRRMDVFRTLMRTRRAPMTAEHVGALNLIEIEFASDLEVQSAWKKLFEHLADEHPRRPYEVATDVSDKRKCDEAFYRRLADERARLLSKLLHAMAKALNFKIEQLEIFEGGYTPQGWEDELAEQRLVRKFLLDLYQGKVALPVMVFDVPHPPHAETNLSSNPGGGTHTNGTCTA